MLYVQDLTVLTVEGIRIGPLSFEVYVGQSVLIRGVNGSGKTTLLRTLMGLQHCSSGEIQWGIAKTSTLPRISWVGSSMPWVPHAQTAVRYQTHWHHLLRIQRPGLSLPLSWSQYSIHQLSAGQKQWLHLTALLDLDADLWILDEPTESLDTTRKNLLRQSCQHYTQAGGVILMACHELWEENFWTTYVDLS